MYSFYKCFYKYWINADDWHSVTVTSSNSLDELKLQNGPSLNNNNNNNNNDKNDDLSNLNHVGPSWQEAPSPVLASNHRLTPILNKTSNLSPILPRTNAPTPIVMSTPAPNTTVSVFGTPASASPAFSTASTSSLANAPTPAMNRSPIPVTSVMTPKTSSPTTSMASVSPALSGKISNDVSQINQTSVANTITTSAVSRNAYSFRLNTIYYWSDSCYLYTVYIVYTAFCFSTFHSKKFE